MKFIRAIVFLSFLPVLGISQLGTDVRGVVTDQSGPVVGAMVTLTSTEKPNIVYTTKTDPSGLFNFSPKQAGDYVISASYQRDNKNGVSETRSIRVLYEGTVGIDLKIENYRPIEETVTVRISADRVQPLDEVSKTVNIISGQEMRDRADITLVDSLRTIPGLRVQQLGGFGKLASIKARGLRNQDTAILIDGVRFRDPTSISGDATSFLSDFTLTSVSKVEVLRGSGSSLYGTNAIGGTVDFQTPVPQSGWHGQVSSAFGGLGLGRFRGNVSKGTRDGKYGFNVGVSRTAYTKGIDDQDNASNTGFQSRIELNPFSRTNISVRFFVSDASVRLNSNPDTVSGGIPVSNTSIIDAVPNVNFLSDINDPDSRQKSQFFNGQVAVTHTFTDQLFFKGYYSAAKTKRTNDNGILGIGFQSASTSVFDGTIQTANGHLAWTPNKYSRLTAGYEFEHEEFGNEGFTPSGTANFLTTAKQSSHTFFAQDLVSFLDGRLQLAGGFRAQVFALDDPTFSSTNAPYQNLTLDNPPSAVTFDGAASYFFSNSGTKLRAHIGNGYRIPSLYERIGSYYSTFGTPGFVPLGDPGLKPEKTIAFDAGIEQSIFDSKGKLTVTYFYTKLIDTIGFDNNVTSFGRFGGYANTKGGIARGAELSGHIRPTGSTDIFVSYTYTNSDQRLPQVAGTRFLNTFGIPESQFTAVVTQRIKKFWVTFDLLATSSYLAPIFDTNNFFFQTYVYRFEGNRRGDLTAGYTFPFKEGKMGLRVFGTVENLFDNEYFENGFRTIGRTARVGISFAF